MSMSRHHAEWLALIDISGPFLSLRTLAQAFPQGLDSPDTGVAQELRLAYEEWLDNSLGNRPDAALHRAWVEWTLRRVLGLPDETVLTEASGDARWERLSVTVPEHGETLRPDMVIAEPGDDGKVRILVQIVPPGQDLERAPAKAAWQASPATRMMTLLRGTGVRLGLLTNGEQWMLVDRPADENLATGFASWYARLWLDEPVTLRAFRSLLGAQRLFGVPESESLEALLAASADDRQEVTDQLGYQVRRAVELLVQALDLADQNEGRRLLRDLPPERLYEASLTVMMRLVFLLFAEEQNLLLLGDDIYDRNYAASTLLESLREAADRVGEEVLERRYDAWGRLLAIFRAVYGGFRHDRMAMPGYGGRLFDPDRYPFLEGRAEGSAWQESPADPPQISNRTVLHLLEALQVLRMRVRDGAPVETRRLSFRALDIEQIGHVYEGLLDHTAMRAPEPILGLAGTREQEPEIALAELERQAKKGDPAFLAFLKEQTGRSESALKKAYAAPLDAFRATQLRAACGNDDSLYARVVPFAGLVRNDDYGRPAVIPAGSVYVTAGAERRATGTHYTPRSLTEPIVQHTLEPLVYHGPAEGLPKEEWKLRPAADLLRLTVCDMAMGSGAFLVQACRYLSERLLEAWAAAEGGEGAARRLITPDGFATTNPDEAIPAAADERAVFARRLIADRCLYGVDKNPLAAEMAKLSLWLITLAKGRPFSFLDHAFRAGDSLLGISDLEQLTRWSLRKEQANPNLDWVTGPVEKALRQAFALRREIRTAPVLDARDAARKADLLARAEGAMALVRLGADLLVAAALAPDAKAREERRGRFLTRYAMLLRAADEGRDVTGPAAELRRDAEALLQGRRPFHWPLEFPEVFDPNLDERPIEQMLVEATSGMLSTKGTSPGFSAVVGNPPFQGGQRITGVLGTVYRDYLVDVLAGGKRGSADLCAYFFLRVGGTLRRNGMAGLLATNTIAQGDTREVGLEQLFAKGITIPRAVPSREWPGNAALEVAHVWLNWGEWQGGYVLNDRAVTGITPLLHTPGATSGNPYVLKENGGKSFIGSIALGSGFLLDAEEVNELIKKDYRNKDVLFPYLSGEDLNSRPDQSPSRWAIYFFDWPLSRAEEYPDCLKILRERVYPERQKNNDKQRRETWWRFTRPTIDLYSAIKGRSRVLFHGFTSKYLCFNFVPTGIVYAGPHVVVAFEYNWQYAVLQSFAHENWVLQYCSTHETRIRYAPSDLFETFPFPSGFLESSNLAIETRRATDISGFVALRGVLDNIGEKYHSYRQSIMLARQEGLTKIYNRFHDPKESSADIAELRRLHVEMDNAVAAAYGWSDLELEHGFHETKQGLRYTISEAARREVLDRLLRLNHERYAEEVAAGLHDKGAKKAAKGGEAAKPAPKSKAASSPVAPQLTLGFDDTPAPVPSPTAKANGEAYVRLKALLAQRGSLSNGEVQVALGIDGEAARALLQRLVEEGVAAVVGQKRGTRYVWRRGS